MSSLRKLIENPPPVKEKWVEYTDPVTKEEMRFFLKGKADANVIARAILLTPSQKMAKAQHYNRITESEFSELMVVQVILVKQALVDLETPPTDDNPIPRYDESEIAKIATTHPKCFFKMVAEAVDIFGLVDGDLQDGSDLSGDPMIRNMVGNSQSAVDMNSHSSSGQSAQPESTPESSGGKDGAGEKSSTPPPAQS